MKTIKDLEPKIQQLSPELIEELDTYLDNLLERCESANESKPLKQDWAGGLKDEHYSSVELQKKALEWRLQKDI